MLHPGRASFAACALAAVLVAASCGGNGSTGKAAPRTTAAASRPAFCKGTKSGSQVVVYSTSGLDYWYNDVLTAFQGDCGVKVVYQSDTSPKIEQELEDEKQQPFADVVIAEAPDLTKADAAGVLVAGGTPGSAGVPDSRCGRGRDWCDVVENFVSLVYNPTLVKDPPRTLDDLLAPRFAGRILLSDLVLADDGRSLLDLVDAAEGRDAALRYITQLEPLVKSHWVTTDTMSRLVSQGQALVANGDLRENLNDLPQYGNLVIWFPQIGVGRTTLAMPYGAALVAGGHNRANATALLEFLWSKDGQVTVADAPGLPARPDVVPVDCRTRDMQRRLANVRIIRPDWERLAADQKVLDAAWLRLKRAAYGVPPPAIGIPPLEPC